MSDLIEYSPDGDIVWIRFNRPDKRNAISRELAYELRDALGCFEKDDSLHAAILAGEGKSFCAGGDITMFPSIDTITGLEFVRRLGASIYETFDRLRKPVIAAVHGSCIAGGLELALACHFIYASKDAVFGMEEVKLGLLPGWGGTVRLARAVPVRLATELLVTGCRFDAEDARRYGIVNQLFGSREECWAAAAQTASAIAKHSPLAVECILDVVKHAGVGGDHAFSLEQLSAGVLFGSEPAQRSIGKILDRGIGR